MLENGYIEVYSSPSMENRFTQILMQLIILRKKRDITFAYVPQAFVVGLC